MNFDKVIFDEVITSLVVVVLKDGSRNIFRSLDAEGGKKSLISSSM
jgi:hypothetical protein